MSKDGMPSPAVAAQWRDRLWKRAEGVGGALFAAALQLLGLHRVLVKKKVLDPLMTP